LLKKYEKIRNSIFGLLIKFQLEAGANLKSQAYFKYGEALLDDGLF
jgi:hypothetical protein